MISCYRVNRAFWWQVAVRDVVAETQMRILENKAERLYEGRRQGEVFECGKFSRVS